MEDIDEAEGVEEAGRYLSGEDVVLTDGGDEKYPDGGTVEGGGGPAISRRTAIAGAGTIVAAIGIGAYSMTQSGGDAEAGGGSSDPEGGGGVETETPETDTTSTSDSVQDGWRHIGEDVYVNGELPWRKLRMEADSPKELANLAHEKSDHGWYITDEFGIRKGEEGEEYWLEDVAEGSIQDTFAYDYLGISWNKEGSDNNPSSGADFGGVIYCAFPPYETFPEGAPGIKKPYIFLTEDLDLTVADDRGKLGGTFEFNGSVSKFKEEYDIKG